MLIGHKTNWRVQKQPWKKNTISGIPIFQQITSYIYWSFSDWPTPNIPYHLAVYKYFITFSKVCNSKFFSFCIIFLLLHDTKIEAKNKNHLWKLTVLSFKSLAQVDCILRSRVSSTVTPKVWGDPSSCFSGGYGEELPTGLFRLLADFISWWL